ncbi:sulfate transporter family protein [Chelatococcus sp. SYSU_G07232]|uniref:Sulfate transporter family protein n=1 Tax=Chelatococcus albus TaxID=3047466 RepID=A0ABT7AHD3_9HYPH|nr:sulfate transporter family protein [Chelatococcus sp. SYSU_G07232]MDJ1158778.1 sulfate transporter family protein [Chelatococcus sp. SYSU_G07232]
MIIEAAFKAWWQILSPPFRRILWRSLALTLALLALAWLGLTRLLALLMERYQVFADYPLVDSFAFAFAGIGMLVALAFLVPPVSALVAGYFLDDAAELVERRHYGQEPPGAPLSLGRSIVFGLRFAALSLLVNAVALTLIFIPGVNLVAFFVANGYLLGREYFELAAGRFRPMPEAAAMRAAHRGAVFLAGLAIAAVIAVPVLNLVTPLFGIALMVHVHKRLSARATAVPARATAEV